MAVKCIRPLRVGTRRTLRSGSTPASVYPSDSRSEPAGSLQGSLVLQVLTANSLRAPFIHARIPRAPLPRSRSPCTMGYCPRVPFAVSVDFPWGWPGLQPCLAPPFTCLLPLQPGFPRAPSRWSRPPPSRLLGSTHSTQCGMPPLTYCTSSCPVRRSTSLQPPVFCKAHRLCLFFSPVLLPVLWLVQVAGDGPVIRTPAPCYSPARWAGCPLLRRPAATTKGTY